MKYVRKMCFYFVEWDDEDKITRPYCMSPNFDKLKPCKCRGYPDLCDFEFYKQNSKEE